ncbi:MAG: CesT family type III secretion system chaperone [Pseudomonadota bacterium]
MHSELKELLEKWAALSGLVDFAANADGSYSLLFDGEYEVRLSQTLRVIRLEADLGELAKDRTAASAVLDELMLLQLAGGQSAAETLSIDDETGRLILFNCFQANRLTAQLFASALSQFVNAQEFWTRQLHELRAPALSSFTPMTVAHA